MKTLLAVVHNVLMTGPPGREPAGDPRVEAIAAASALRAAAPSIASRSVWEIDLSGPAAPGPGFAHDEPNRAVRANACNAGRPDFSSGRCCEDIPPNGGECYG